MLKRGASAINDIQRRHRASLVKLAKDCAERGETLRYLARTLGMNYSSLKMALARRGYEHPRGMALVDAHLMAISGIGLLATVAELADRGLSRGAIARDLDIDAASLQRIADKSGILFPKTFTLRDPSRIIAAMKVRIHLRQDLRHITFDGCTHYLSEWARLKSIPETTLRKRLASGWSVESALSAPVGARGRGRRGAVREKPSGLHPWRKERDQFMTARADRENADAAFEATS